MHIQSPSQLAFITALHPGVQLKLMLGVFSFHNFVTKVISECDNCTYVAVRTKLVKQWHRLDEKRGICIEKDDRDSFQKRRNGRGFYRSGQKQA
jgi:hypothetical protein